MRAFGEQIWTPILNRAAETIHHSVSDYPLLLIAVNNGWFIKQLTTTSA